MSDDTPSKFGIRIRLTDERWEHIVTEHAEPGESRAAVLRAVSDPERILAGGSGELLSVREIESGKWLVVVYREDEQDGFIITAFWTRRYRSLEKRDVVWLP
jgi:hypothetical protein